jgi:hypothetical protein
MLEWVRSWEWLGRSILATNSPQSDRSQGLEEEDIFRFREGTTGLVVYVGKDQPMISDRSVEFSR